MKLNVQLEDSVLAHLAAKSLRTGKGINQLLEEALVIQPAKAPTPRKRKKLNQRLSGSMVKEIRTTVLENPGIAIPKFMYVQGTKVPYQTAWSIANCTTYVSDKKAEIAGNGFITKTQANEYLVKRGKVARYHG
jgi:hypothetical protein